MPAKFSLLCPDAVSAAPAAAERFSTSASTRMLPRAARSVAASATPAFSLTPTEASACCSKIWVSTVAPMAAVELPPAERLSSAATAVDSSNAWTRMSPAVAVRETPAPARATVSERLRKVLTVAAMLAVLSGAPEAEASTRMTFSLLSAVSEMPAASTAALSPRRAPVRPVNSA